jgi:hypothetical protein
MLVDHFGVGKTAQEWTGDHLHRATDDLAVLGEGVVVPRKQLPDAIQLSGLPGRRLPTFGGVDQRLKGDLEDHLRAAAHDESSGRERDVSWPPPISGNLARGCYSVANDKPVRSRSWTLGVPHPGAALMSMLRILSLRVFKSPVSP